MLSRCHLWAVRGPHTVSVPCLGCERPTRCLSTSSGLPWPFVIRHAVVHSNLMSVQSLSPFGLDTAFSALVTSLNCPAAICALTAATRLPQHHIILPTCLRAFVWPADAKMALFLFCTLSQSLCWIASHKSAERLAGERPLCSPRKWDTLSLSPHQGISFGQSPAVPSHVLTQAQCTRRAEQAMAWEFQP